MPLAQNLRPLDRDNSQTGILAPPPWRASQARTSAANFAYFGRFVPSRPMTITKIAFVVTTAAGVDDPCDVGLYDAAGTRLVSAGATSGLLNTTGVKAVTVSSTSLSAGVVYYAALSFGTVGGTSASLEGVSPGTTVGLTANIFGSTVGLIESGAAGTSHPLPSSATISASTSAVPLMAVRES